MMETEELQDLMDALQKVLGALPGKEGDDSDDEPKSKGKAVTILSIKKMGKGDLKIPKIAKGRDSNDE